MRVHSDVGAAIGVERIWSLSRTALTDNRKSMINSRLMQLVKLKQSMHLFEDDNTDVLACSNFDDILDEAVAFEEEEMLSRTSVQPDIAIVDSDEEGEPKEDALEDEEIDWEAEAMCFCRTVETMIACRSVGQLHIDEQEVFWRPTICLIQFQSAWYTIKQPVTHRSKKLFSGGKKAVFRG
jgi:hypothetical protein